MMLMCELDLQFANNLPIEINEICFEGATS